VKYLATAAAFSIGLLAWCHGGSLVQRASSKARPLSNPLEDNPEAQVAGAKLYQRECATCHGESREGSARVPPLAQPEVYRAAPGTLFWILRNGSLTTGMPSFAHLPEVQRWQIIAFLTRATPTSAQGAHTGYVGVANNGCESCPRPHNPAVASRLLKAAEENVCYACHNGTVTSSGNIQAEFQGKRYVHPVSTTPSVHDASEGPRSTQFPLPKKSLGAQRHPESFRQLPHELERRLHRCLLAWAVQRGTALLTTPGTAARARENFNISALPEDALDEINRIQTRQRFNEVVKTGSPVSFHKVDEHEIQTVPGVVHARGTNTRSSE
jgi:predicted CXXCH cytochrome family protein